jgi:hypothetical protein
LQFDSHAHGATRYRIHKGLTVKFTVKLPVAFAAVLMLLPAAALDGIHSLNQSLNSFRTAVQTSTDAKTPLRKSGTDANWMSF